jgi:bifunctional DNA-binding transcriptional regulator/antitoxin component of YhaV-PrlF toxin-antitoxin module
MDKKFVRKLQRTGEYSYIINIPKEMIDKFRWQERQKLEISFGDNAKEIVIKDWSRKSKK